MTTTWRIAELKRKPDTEVVFEVVYIMNFNDQGKRRRHVGVVELTGDPSDPSFIPFNELTEEVVIGWVQNHLGETEIQNLTNTYQTSIQQEVEREQNPEFLTGTPWNSPGF